MKHREWYGNPKTGRCGGTFRKKPDKVAVRCDRCDKPHYWRDEGDTCDRLVTAS